MKKNQPAKKDSKKKPVDEATRWRKLLAEQKSSGLSKEAFSKKRGVSISTFRRWEQKWLAEKNTQNTPATNPSVTPSKKVVNNTQNMTRAERETHWQAIVKKFHDSGLSQTRFCKEHNVSMTTLSEWKNYFLKAANLSMNGQFEQSLTHPGKLELKHPSGFSMVIDANTPQALLMKTLESLAKLTA